MPSHWKISHSLAALGLVCASSACDKRDEPKATPAASASAAVPASANVTRIPRPKLPSGPVLAILAGQGVGPIRLGANTATIERLMEKPCETKNETLCRYASRGVEFELKDGVTEAIQIHNLTRSFDDGNGKRVEYGVFNGWIAPDVRLGNLPWAVQERLGKPERVEKLDAKGKFGVRERHHYNGLVLDYEPTPKGDALFLGGIRVIKKARPDNQSKSP